MLRIAHKDLIRSTPRKLIALAIGYHVWIIISSYVPTYRWIKTPICFYNTSPQTQLLAPESIQVRLAGPRRSLCNLDPATLAVHVNAHTLTSDTNRLILSDYELLLPPHLHVVDWAPSNIVITRTTDNGASRANT